MWVSRISDVAGDDGKLLHFPKDSLEWDKLGVSFKEIDINKKRQITHRDKKITLELPGSRERG